MKLPWLTCVFVALLTMAPSAQTNPTGTWKAEFTGGQANPFGVVILHLRASGNTITGTARLGYSWPGDAVITDAKFDGQRLSFTAIASKGWSETNGGGTTIAPVVRRVDHCCPKMLFTGTIHGNAMTLAMVSSSTESSSDDGSKPFRLAGKKVSSNPNIVLEDERH